MSVLYISSCFRRLWLRLSKSSTPAILEIGFGSTESSPSFESKRSCLCRSSFMDISDCRPWIFKRDSFCAMRAAREFFSAPTIDMSDFIFSI